MSRSFSLRIPSSVHRASGYGERKAPEEHSSESSRRLYVHRSLSMLIGPIMVRYMAWVTIGRNEDRPRIL